MTVRLLLIVSSVNHYHNQSKSKINLAHELAERNLGPTAETKKSVPGCLPGNFIIKCLCRPH